MERTRHGLIPPPGVARTAFLWQTAMVGALFAMAVLAAAATHWLSMPAMRIGPLTGAPMPSVSPGQVGALALFLFTWTIMMVAMMFPAMAPVVVTFHRWVRRTARPRSQTMLFLAGYLVVWAAAGVLGYVAVVALGALLPSGRHALQFGGLVLVLAGTYQFSSLKDTCLRQCRSPMGTLAQRFGHMRRGGVAGTYAGAANGLACLGCCWLFMLVLILLGMMSLVWMAAIGGIIFVEKVLPPHWPVRPSVGLVLIMSGVAVAAGHTVGPHVA